MVFGAPPQQGPGVRRWLRFTSLMPQHPRHLKHSARAHIFQVEELTSTRDADAAQFESDLAALRDRVAAVLQRMFGSEIDEGAALEELRELGCEVRFVPEARRRWGAGRNNSSRWVVSDVAGLGER